MIKKIAILGAGTMGHSIAENFALYGFDVNLYDPDENRITSVGKDIRADISLLAEEGFIDVESIEKALSNIHYFSDLKEAVYDRDFITESIPENMELKQQIFKQLDDFCPEHTIFTSNTSSLPLGGMWELVSEKRRQRMMITHYYNPAHIMPLVELSHFGNMPEEIFQEVEDLFKSINKQSVKVNKDAPGLVANRIQQGVAREVFSIIEQGIADPEDVDKALMYGPAFRYATTGQLEVADMGGLDIWCTVGDNLLAVMDNRKEANPLLREKVNEGRLGAKTGEGFFKYESEALTQKRNDFNKRLIHQLKASQYYMKETSVPQKNVLD
ncbi:3-hydroxyacyl-CoA dehydrogenase family protein [Bacillus sp. EB01]|uniref:3-hydroxyacyl-CoA dehydrogenase family protein n=1 Tax=Bacillus sp. EB01 TaxID=1347086 RepID=UPI0005C66B66|nr:3-hydroxyacyl-CoA dehydrogenase NAD-binding domain-containing protein [Bacillus sp. EB01]